MKRYVVLDSWRGICACLVALYHFKANSHFYEMGLIRGAFIFTDFFFVLSGFVITGAYQAKLLEGLSPATFMKKRFTRLWPLHCFMLFCFVIYIIVKDKVLGTVPLFSEKEYSLKSFLENLFLLQGLGLEHTTTWNQPSWSISVEFYTYFLFAIITVFFQRFLWLAELCIVIAAPVMLAQTEHANMDFTYDYGLLRCLYGFSMGSLSYKIHNNYLKDKSWMNRFAFMSLAEAAVISAVAIFCIYTFTNKFSLLSPYLFLGVILIFAQEKGALSVFLSGRYLVQLGALSYSIYMVHEFIQLCLYKAFTIFEHLLHRPFLTHSQGGGGDDFYMGATPSQGDIFYLAMLVIVIAASLPAHRYVENYLKDGSIPFKHSNRQRSAAA